MNTKPINDDTSQRQSRLKAMQARRKQAMGEDVSPQIAPNAAGGPRGGPFGQDASFGASGDEPAKAAGGQRAAMLQKVRKFVSRPEGGIDQNKAKMLIQFVKRQASDPAAPRHDQAKKIMDAISKLDPAVRRKLLGGAGQGGGGLGGGGGIGGQAGRGMGQAGGLAARLGGTGRGPRAGGGQMANPEEAAMPGGSEKWFDDLLNKL